MIAIVLAGGTPQPGEHLYPQASGKPKAMIPINGKPMIQWVLDALDQATQVDRIILVGLPEEYTVECHKPLFSIPSQGGILQNVRAGIFKALEIDPTAGHIVTVSSDLPGITPQAVDWVVSTAMQTNEDAYYTVISRSAMEARYPNSKRSYTRLKDAEVCGGDVNVISTHIGAENDAIWKQIFAARKNVFKQASLIGFDTLILVLLRWITLDQAVQTVARRLHLTGRALLCPYPEVGMDVDKAFQLDIMIADLSQRRGG